MLKFPSCSLCWGSYNLFPDCTGRSQTNVLSREEIALSTQGTTNIDDKNTTKSTLFLCFLRRCSYLVCGWECEEVRSKTKIYVHFILLTVFGRFRCNTSVTRVWIVRFCCHPTPLNKTSKILDGVWSDDENRSDFGWFWDFSKGYPLCFFFRQLVSK